MDITGKRIITKNHQIVSGRQSLQINTSKIASNGVYLLNIEGENVRKVMRLVKAN